MSTASPPLVGAKKQPQGPIGKSMRLFKLHSNGLEPLTFGSVVPQGFLSPLPPIDFALPKRRKRELVGGLVGGL